jgi:hypothetical protein
MFLFYADFGPNGANITNLGGRRKVGQYVVFSSKMNTPDGLIPVGMPVHATYQALSIAAHDLITDDITWYKHRTQRVDPTQSVTEEERKMLLIQLLASEPW